MREGERAGGVQALHSPCSPETPLSTATGGGGPPGPDPGREAGRCPPGGTAQRFRPNPEAPGRDGIAAGPGEWARESPGISCSNWNCRHEGHNVQGLGDPSPQGCPLSPAPLLVGQVGRKTLPPTAGGTPPTCHPRTRRALRFTWLCPHIPPSHMTSFRAETMSHELYVPKALGTVPKTFLQSDTNSAKSTFACFLPSDLQGNTETRAGLSLPPRFAEEKTVAQGFARSHK